MDRDNLYTEFEDEIDFIDMLHSDEALDKSEVIAASALGRQKSQLETQKIKLQSQMTDVDEKIAALEAKIASMQAT